jgi:hypothetical protein
MVMEEFRCSGCSSGGFVVLVVVGVVDLDVCLLGATIF